MSNQPDSKTYRENYKILKDTADWLARPEVSSMLGRRYESELARHFRPS